MLSLGQSPRSDELIDAITRACLLRFPFVVHLAQWQTIVRFVLECADDAKRPGHTPLDRHLWWMRSSRLSQPATAEKSPDLR